MSVKMYKCTKTMKALSYSIFFPISTSILLIAHRALNTSKKSLSIIFYWKRYIMCKVPSIRMSGYDDLLQENLKLRVLRM